MFANIRSVHFVGICGTAMASAAVAMHDKGFHVTGSDANVYPPMSTFLEEHSIPVFHSYSESNLREQPDLVVIGNAISRGNPEAELTLERKWRYCSLPELLKEFFIRGKRCLVVAGTHGKTTTTSLLTWVFEQNELNPSFLIGGIPSNFSKGARFTDSEWFIIEGDEYDTAFFDKRSKFVHYLPEVVLLNNLEFDHADIFPNIDAIQNMFKRLVNIVPRNGLVLANGDDKNLEPVIAIKHAPVKRFGLGENNEARGVVLSLDSENSKFSLNDQEFVIPLTGELNVRNALAVAACCLHCGLSPDQIRRAFASFKGIRRRMEVRGVARDVTVVDDFGHHPTALRETLRALRIRFPGQRLWAIFEPRSNTTRRNIFQADLAEALGLADLVVVSEVARLELLAPSERLDPVRLMSDLHTIGRPAWYLPNVDAIVAHAGNEAHPGDVICVFSNGGFGGIHEKLLSKLRGIQPAASIT